MASTHAPIGRVLSTLNEDGTRRWLRPRPSSGAWRFRRTVVGWLLVGLFAALPWIRIGGEPAVLLDIPGRRFHLLGTTFGATDTALLMLLMLAILVGIFWITALFGRVWCGWGCPQTVYLELLFRPLERLIEGSPAQQRKLDRQGLSVRRILKYAVFAFISVVLANIFLSYFVGTDRLLQWVVQSPLEHPIPFAVVLATSGLVFFDFGFFREQMCVVACPYARLQSVLLDRHSWVVGYDSHRGEPRGKRKGRHAEGTGGDCVNCGACVATCPTGIDIRDGLQLECIGCAQCVDACDQIMDRLGAPRGLIRYTSEAQQTDPTQRRQVIRPRVVIYPALLVILVSILSWSVLQRQDMTVTVLRGLGAPFEQVEPASVRNQLRLRVANRSGQEQRVYISIPGLAPSALVVPTNPVNIPGDSVVTVPVFITLPQQAFSDGARTVELVFEGPDSKHITQATLLAPRLAGDT